MELMAWRLTTAKQNGSMLISHSNVVFTQADCPTDSPPDSSFDLSVVRHCVRRNVRRTQRRTDSKAMDVFKRSRDVDI